MDFQPKKTVAMMFRYRKDPATIKLLFKGQELQQVTSFRYLGLHIDQHFSWLQHVKTLIPRVVGYAGRLLPALRQKRPLQKAIARRLCVGAMYPILTYGHIVWGVAANRKKTHRLLNRAVRAFHLSVARCPPSTADHLLPKLTQIPSLQATINYQATKALITNEQLLKQFVIPWCNDPKVRRKRKGYQLRNYIHTLLSPHQEELQELVKDYIVQRKRQSGRTIQVQVQDPTKPLQELKNGETSVWMYAQSQGSNSPLHALIVFNDRHYACIRLTGLGHTNLVVALFAVYVCFAQARREQTPPPTMTHIYMDYQPDLCRLSQVLSPTEIQQTVQDYACDTAHMIHIQTQQQVGNTQRHSHWRWQLNKMAWRQEVSRLHWPTVVTRHCTPLVQSRRAASLSILQHYQQHRQTADTDNSTVQQLFPTEAHLAVFADLNSHSWALGQLVSGQHPLAQHLCDTFRRPTPLCPVCSQADETLAHFLFECPHFALERQRHLHPVLQHTDSPYTPALLSETAGGLQALDRYLLATRRFFTAAWLPQKTPNRHMPTATPPTTITDTLMADAQTDNTLPQWLEAADVHEIDKSDDDDDDSDDDEN